MDFAALPPEINSALMYAGPGPGPMLATAAAWEALAAELRSAATGYGSTILELADIGWQGPSSAAMAAAATPYVAWMHATAALAEQAGRQASAAAAAHEAAFLATVPPPLIAANRMLLMQLIATNFLGINTPAIAATEAQYCAMWAQDAVAMYAYAGASAAASMLAPMPPAPATTNPGGLAANALMTGGGANNGMIGSMLTQAVSGLAGSASMLTGGLGGGVGNLGSTLGQGSEIGASALSALPGSAALGLGMPFGGPGSAAGLAGLARVAPSIPATHVPEIPARQLMPSAGWGQATSVGRLSVPPRWTSVADAVPGAASDAGSMAAAPAAAPLLGRGMSASDGLHMRGSGAAGPPRLVVVPRSSVVG